MERLLREVPGGEYVYSISRPGLSMLVVRFLVGTKEEDAIIKAYNKLYSNFDRIPAGVSQPIIKVRSIDDVPIFAVTKDTQQERSRKNRHEWSRWHTEVGGEQSVDQQQDGK